MSHYLKEAYRGAALVALVIGTAACGYQNDQARIAANAPQVTTYDALVQSANAKLRAGDYASAVNLYRNASQVEPEISEPLQLMGLALASGGAPEEATEAYRDALTLDPNDLEARRGLANSLVAMDEPAMAIPHYRLILERRPADYRAYLGLGVAYDLMGQHAAARAVYESGLMESPDNPDLTHNLGLSNVLAGNFDEGVAQLRQVADGPNAGMMQRQTLAMALVFAGRPAEAREVASLDLGPTEVDRNINYFQTINGLSDADERRRAVRAFLGSSEG